MTQLFYPSFIHKQLQSIFFLVLGIIFIPHSPAFAARQRCREKFLVKNWNILFMYMCLMDQFDSRECFLANKNGVESI